MFSYTYRARGTGAALQVQLVTQVRCFFWKHWNGQSKHVHSANIPTVKLQIFAFESCAGLSLLNWCWWYCWDGMIWWHLRLLQRLLWSHELGKQSLLNFVTWVSLSGQSSVPNTRDMRVVTVGELMAMQGNVSDFHFRWDDVWTMSMMWVCGLKLVMRSHRNWWTTTKSWYGPIPQEAPCRPSRRAVAASFTMLDPEVDGMPLSWQLWGSEWLLGCVYRQGFFVRDLLGCLELLRIQAG